MNLLEYSLAGAGIAAISSILTGYVAIRNFKKSIQEDVEDKLRAEIKALSDRVEAVKDSVEKDLDHTKLIFNNEIKHLSGKIESLRDEIREQYRQQLEQQSQLVDLIKEVVGKS